MRDSNSERVSHRQTCAPTQCVCVCVCVRDLGFYKGSGALQAMSSENLSNKHTALSWARHIARDNRYRWLRSAVIGGKTQSGPALNQQNMLFWHGPQLYQISEMLQKCCQSKLSNITFRDTSELLPKITFRKNRAFPPGVCVCVCKPEAVSQRLRFRVP